MVDLAKIRKKKAKEAEGAGGRAQGAGEGVEASGLPGAEDQGAGRRAQGAEEQPSEASTGRRAEGPQSPEQPSNPATQAPGNPATGQPGNQATKLDKFKQTAGQRRAAATAQVTEQATQLELLTFVIANEQYAVDIERIVEIVTPRPLTRIPNADGSVLGIVSLRGTIVTLVDVRRKLRHPAAGASDADTRIVVVDYHNETVGFVVDRVLRVVKTAPGEVEPHPVVHASELDESVRGVFRAGGALTILLDLDKLLDSRALAATVA